MYMVHERFAAAACESDAFTVRSAAALFLALLAGSISCVTRRLLLGQQLHQLFRLFALFGFNGQARLFLFPALALLRFTGSVFQGLGGQALFFGARRLAFLAGLDDSHAFLGALVGGHLGGFGPGFCLGQHLGAGLCGRIQTVGEFFVVLAGHVSRESKISGFKNAQRRRQWPVGCIHNHHSGLEGSGLRLLHPGIGDDDDKIALLGETGGGAVDADDAGAWGRRNGISRKALAVVDVENIDLLMGQNAGALHQGGVDRDRTFIIEVALGHHRAMDFAFEQGELHQLSKKLLSFRLRLGCFSFLSALASIWRMRSRVTLNCWPTSSSVWSVFMPMPKRMRSTRSSRGVSDASTRVVVSRRFDWMAASIGSTAFLSSMKSPRCESSSSPIGVSSEIGSLAILSTLRTFSSGMPSFSASSSGVGSRPISCSICRLVRTILLIVSIMCTGMRMVRAWSAIERVIAWRIHHVA